MLRQWMECLLNMELQERRWVLTKILTWGTILTSKGLTKYSRCSKCNKWARCRCLGKWDKWGWCLKVLKWTKAALWTPWWDRFLQMDRWVCQWWTKVIQASLNNPIYMGMGRRYNSLSNLSTLMMILRTSLKRMAHKTLMPTMVPLSIQKLPKSWSSSKRKSKRRRKKRNRRRKRRNKSNWLN